MSKHKANVHGATVGRGGLMDQMAPRKRSDGTTAGGDAISGTSIFDPVLAELLYRWFCPPEGTVIDPFAGGSVRGIVAGMLGLHYFGMDLRAEQIEANREQADLILGAASGAADYRVGDSATLRQSINEWTPGQFDFMLTCPPYADLEVYSDDPADISNKPYKQFLHEFENIIAGVAPLIRQNRFVAIVVGDARDKRTGLYYGFPAHTVSAFQRCGFHLYNEAILVTPAGTLPGRARNGFVNGRKLGRTHQVAYVFVKGDPKEATKACGVCEFGQNDPFSADTPFSGDPLEGLGIKL